MASIGIINFYGFTLFLYVTSVITLTVNDGAGTITLTSPPNRIDNNETIKGNNSKIFKSIPMEGGGEAASTHNEPKSFNANSTTTPKSKSSTEIISEGREMELVETTPKQRIIPRKEAGSMYPEMNETKSVPPIKETKTIDTLPIKPTKPTKPTMPQEQTSSLKDHTTNNLKPVTESVSEKIIKTDNITIDHSSNVTNNTKQNISTSALETNVTTLKPDVTSKKHKPKPTATIGGTDIDKPIPASPTKTTPLGVPSKVDYIVPVIITILALPVLGAIAFIMYSRGRDCWDKRHYRRMDFLIDGMYND